MRILYLGFLISILAACTIVPVEIKYKPFSELSYSNRISPARIYNGDIADLLDSDFLLIGYIDVRRNIRKCYEDNACKTVTDGMPSEKDVLVAAAQRGGDLVILLEDKDISEGITKSVCTSTSVNTMTVNGTVQVYTVCDAYLMVRGRLESKISRALVWRRNPDSAGIEANTRAIGIAMQTLDEEFSRIKNKKVTSKRNNAAHRSEGKVSNEDSL